MKTLESRTSLVVNCSADQIWDWLSNLRHCMTANQFHLEIDCDDAKAASPHVGMEVPILHGVMGYKVYRIARITRFQDYEITWGERLPDDADYEDPFPHSEGWRVESLGAHECRIHTHLRGQFMSPMGQLVGEYVWDNSIPVGLDSDIEDVAIAAGALEHKSITLSQDANALLRIVHAHTINGEPITEFLNKPFGMKEQH